MSEFQHHQTWLAPIVEQLENEGSTLDEKTLRDGEAICNRVLLQNHKSTLAYETLKRIHALLEGERTSEVPSEEQRLQDQIEAFETRFLDYGTTRMTPLIQGLPDNKKGLKHALQYPFDIIALNKEHNAAHNFETAQRMAEREGKPITQFMWEQQHPHYFAMDSLGKDHPQYTSIKAGYAPLMRMMAFNPDLNPNNEFDHFVLMHECLHVPQMAQRAMHQPQLFMHLNGAGDQTFPRTLVDDEYQAYGLEIEALNLRFQDAIKQAAENGHEFSWKEMKQELGGTSDPDTIFQLLCLLGKVYYEEGCDAATNKYGPRFKDINIKNCLHDGYEVYSTNEQGQLIRIKG